MDCRTAQEQIIESLAEGVPGAAARDLAAHLTGCEVCRTFSEMQRLLDVRLGSVISAPSLSAGFRPGLAKRMRRDSFSVWPGFLPDIAHVAGCSCATVLCLLLLPLAANQVLLGGLAFTLVTYFMQAVLQGSAEGWEEDS